MFGFFKRSQPEKVPVRTRKSYSPSPWKNNNLRSYFSEDSNRVLEGWTSDSAPIDFYLANEMPLMRARSREAVKRNPYAKRFITAIKSNIVGPEGVRIQAQAKMGKKLDERANSSIEDAFKDWAKKDNCDYLGKNSFVGMQQLAITAAGRDGQFLFRVWDGVGKYGLQLQILDPMLLDVTANRKTKGGGEIRLGVEYTKNGKIIRYHFRSRDLFGYHTGSRWSAPASSIIHGFIPEYEDQSQGIPWMHASLERSKHLEKYDESAIVAARAGAMKGGIISGESAEQYEGDEEGVGADEGYTVENIKTGSLTDIGDKKFEAYDPAYPHQMYDAFVKQTLRAISSGIGVSYHTISNDLEGVNYSSIRAGVLEDRELFKGLQNWFIDQFVGPVYERWLRNAHMSGEIKLAGGGQLSRPLEYYQPVNYQPRRWAWVDPQKDENANQTAFNNRTKSRSQIIRDQGNDPDSVFAEIAREQEKLRELGIDPVNAPFVEVKDEEDEEQTKPKK